MSNLAEGVEAAYGGQPREDAQHVAVDDGRGDAVDYGGDRAGRVPPHAAQT